MAGAEKRRSPQELRGGRSVSPRLDPQARAEALMAEAVAARDRGGESPVGCAFVQLEGQGRGPCQSPVAQMFGFVGTVSTMPQSGVHWCQKHSDLIHGLIGEVLATSEGYRADIGYEPARDVVSLGDEGVARRRRQYPQVPRLDFGEPVAMQDGPLRTRPALMDAGLSVEDQLALCREELALARLDAEGDRSRATRAWETLEEEVEHLRFGERSLKAAADRAFEDMESARMALAAREEAVKWYEQDMLLDQEAEEIRLREELQGRFATELRLQISLVEWSVREAVAAEAERQNQTEARIMRDARVEEICSSGGPAAGLGSGG